MASLSTQKEYVLSVATNNIREAIAQLGSALYDLLEQALMTADEEDEESEFDRFARETLNVLASHPEQLSDESQWHETDHDESPFYPEPAE